MAGTVFSRHHDARSLKGVSANMDVANSKPTFLYGPNSQDFLTLHPSARKITYDGRAGLHFTSIRGRAAVPRHTAGENRGSALLWVLPLQDFFPAAHYPLHGKSNPFFERFVFLSDREAVQEIEAANFSLLYSSYWHPVYVAKFSQGTIADAAFNKRTAIATAGHFELRALKWYQLAMTWDHDSGIYALYANGIKIGHSDTTLTEHPHHDLPAPWLYFGNPAYAMGDISFYSEPLTESQISETFAKEAVSIDRDLQTRLEKSYQGRNLPTFDWRPSASSNWKCEQSLSLDRAEDYAHFFQQGCGPCLHFTNEGFRITTPPAHRILSPEGQDNYR